MSDVQSASSPGFTRRLGNKVGGIHLQSGLLGERGPVISLFPGTWAQAASKFNPPAFFSALAQFC